MVPGAQALPPHCNSEGHLHLVPPRSLRVRALRPFAAVVCVVGSFDSKVLRAQIDHCSVRSWSNGMSSTNISSSLAARHGSTLAEAKAEMDEAAKAARDSHKSKGRRGPGADDSPELYWVDRRVGFRAWQRSCQLCRLSPG